MTVRRLLLALLLSVVITFVLVAAYAFYPLVTLLLKQIARGPETSGVAAVRGGVRMTTLLIVEPIVFVIILALLSRRRTKQ